MVSPTARRRAVTFLEEKLSYSERRACVLLDQPRGTQRYLPGEAPMEKQLIKRLHALARRFPRYGYRRLTDMLRNEGWKVNRKRVRRLCRLEGLKVFKQQRRRISRDKTLLLAATRKNHVWSYDFVFDQTANGRTIKILTVIDLFTRECYAIELDRRITAGAVIKVLDQLFAMHGVPEFLRSDNGPEFVAKQIQQWLKGSGVNTQYIERGAPWQNGHIESFHDKLRDECLNSELFFSLAEARVVVEDWRMEYNTIRPHSSLGRISPAAYAAKLPPSDHATWLPTVGRYAGAAKAAPRPTMDNHA
jgi:transposase InsO family protein